MKYINIVYEDDYNDCDIISIPDELLNDIEKYIYIIDEWIHDNLKKGTLTETYYTIINEKKYPILDTIGIVNWLNKNLYNGKSAVNVIKQHTSVCHDYPTVEL